MKALPDQANRVFWSDIYAQLSELFKEPTEEFADDVESGRLINYFKNVFFNLGLGISLLSDLFVSDDAYTILKDEYRKLFFGPLPPYIIPVESAYKEWTKDPRCKLAIAGEKGYLMGDSAIDMIQRYQAHGIVIPEKYSSMPDHIALELEYMAFLCRNEDREKQREFLASHLNWVGELVNDIKDIKVDTKFYSAGAEITALIIFRSMQASKEGIERGFDDYENRGGDRF